MRHRHGHRIGLSVIVISITLVLFENCSSIKYIYNSFDRTYIDEIYATLCCLATLAYSNYFGDGEIQIHVEFAEITSSVVYSHVQLMFCIHWWEMNRNPVPNFVRSSQTSDRCSMPYFGLLKGSNVVHALLSFDFSKQF